MTTKDSGEGGWEEEWIEKFDLTVWGYSPLGTSKALKRAEIIDFISSQIEIAYKKGVEDGEKKTLAQ